jgi:ketosteroid isomerase-like protein
MSQENVDLVRAVVEAFNRRDWDAFFKNLVPSFELDLSRATGPDHGVYGRDQAQRLLHDFSDAWESLRIEDDEYIDAGEHVVAPWTLHAQGRDGIEVPSRVTWVWTVREGEIVRASMYQERQEALEAVGVSGELRNRP